MGDSTSDTPVPSIDQTDNEVSLKLGIRRRYFRAVNYLSIYLFIVVVYGTALIADYLLFWLIWWLLNDDVQKYPLVARTFDYAKIGLAILFIVSAIVHGLFSTYSQIKLDLDLLHEEKK